MIKCKSLSPWLVLIVPFLVSACESIQEKDLTDPAISNTVNNPFNRHFPFGRPVDRSGQRFYIFESTISSCAASKCPHHRSGRHAKAR